MEKFTSSWDTKLKAYNALILLALGMVVAIGMGIPTVIYYVKASMPGARWDIIDIVGLSIPALLTVGTVVPVVIITKLMAVKWYEIGDVSLVIRKGYGSIKIPLGEISKVRKLTDEDMKGVIRLMGIGGLFGYGGLFRTEKLGKFRMYSTKSTGLVLIEAEEPFVLSPDDPEGFLKTIAAAIPKRPEVG